jgi:hypothetical protein
VIDVRLDRSTAQAQSLGDLLVTEPESHKLQHISLTLREENVFWSLRRLRRTAVMLRGGN